MAKRGVTQFFSVAAPLPISPAVPRDIAPNPPSLLFDDLFRNVAASDLFPDFKSFADATPKRPPAVILAAYHANHPTSNEALGQFIKANFRFDRDQNAASRAHVWCCKWGDGR
jgi:alpha,alpha-trehalase